LVEPRRWLEIRTWGYWCQSFCENLPTAIGELFLAEAALEAFPAAFEGLENSLEARRKPALK